MDEETKKQIEEIALETVKRYNRSFSFTDRKIVDTPTEAFSPVNRRFVTLSSNLGARPISSVVVVGQRYFDTTNNTPIWFTAGGWRNSSGSVVAGHLS